MKPLFKTPIRDLGVINFIQEKIGEPLKDSVISDIAESVVKQNPIGSVVMDLIQGDEKINDKFTKADLGEVSRLAKMDQKVIDAEVRLAELELERERLDNEDRSRATEQFLEMQKSDNWMTRNYVVLLATLIVTFGFAMVGTLIFKEIPEGNRTLFTAAFGYVLGAVSTVVIFFFGDNDKNRNS